MSRLVTKSVLEEFLDRLSRSVEGTVYLIGETSQVYASWRDWTSSIELTSDVPDRSAFEAVIAQAAASVDVEVVDEFPGDLIPLPDGFDQRSRAAGSFGHLEIRHFDPYSTAYRFIARGDEPDYHLVLAYIRHGWITIPELDKRLEGLLPRFSMQTIQQDPAEFRRKYKGVMQMARSIEPGTIHRHTPV